MTTLSAKLKRFTFKSVQWPVKLFAKPNILPEDPAADLELDLNQPIYYVLNSYSATDLNLLENECERLGLPLPLARDNQSGYLFGIRILIIVATMKKLARFWIVRNNLMI